MMITKLSRTSLYSYSEITVIRGCIPFFKWEEMVVEGGTQKSASSEKRLKKAPNLDPLRRASDERDPPLPEVDSAVEEVEQGPVGAEEHRVDRQVAPLGVDPPVRRELHLWKSLTFDSGPLNSQRVRITLQAGVIKLYRSVNYSTIGNIHCWWNEKNTTFIVQVG